MNHSLEIQKIRNKKVRYYCENTVYNKYNLQKMW